MKTKNDRNKAFLGAVIGGAASIIGGAISKRKQRKAQEEMYRIQQDERNRQDNVQKAAALSSTYANQEYVDEYKNKVTLKAGGKQFIDRDKYNKRFKCGGRKKAFIGAIVQAAKDSQQDMSALTQGTMNGLNAAINGPDAPTIQMPQVQTPNVPTAASTADKANREKQNPIMKVQPSLTDPKLQSVDPLSTVTLKRLGGKKRKKAMIGADIGSAIQGVGSLIGAATQKVRLPKQIKGSDGYISQPAKQTLSQTDYQLDINGNPINSIDANNLTTPLTKQGIDEARYGKRKLKRK